MAESADSVTCVPVASSRAKFRERRKAPGFHFLCIVWDVLDSYAHDNLTRGPAAPAALPWFIVFFGKTVLPFLGRPNSGAELSPGRYWHVSAFWVLLCPAGIDT